MGVLIDRRNGDVVSEHYRLGRDKTLAGLRKVSPQAYRIVTGPDDDVRCANIVKCALGEWFIHVSVVMCDHRVVGYSLYASREGDSWHNWTEAKEAAGKVVLQGILTRSALGDGELCSWGRAAIARDIHYTTYSLDVTYE